ncbi:hypothetical protein AMTRI_Chr05g57120 [Amborella trichopoda]|uniref:basic salivary proline-rich protein 1 n=1 Tax=Amborella trichopoda TaxID=13333 RepID=UPI0005D3DD88|nr:basic salivary proline-rich protein 1 [Amborella trichopoda]|eukprot:XP_011620562.1 basic salivary proline-rich protein 1 [Amborella trichopoda]
MGSRDQGQGNLSSMVVRPAESGGSDYEPGEVRPRDRDPFYSSSGYGNSDRAGSASPLRHRKVDHHYGSDFDHFGGSRRGRGFRGGRGRGRFRDFSPPPFGRGRGGRSYGRGFEGPDYGSPPSFRGETMSRNNPNVPPREGDWICSEPSCGNLNFARRAYCNNCNKLRRDMAPFRPPGPHSPRGPYPGPPPPHGPPRMGGPPLDRGLPPRSMNGYESPPRGGYGPRGYGSGPPPPRHGGRFSDPRMGREARERERPGFHQEEIEFREREKFGRPLPHQEWGNGPRERERDDFFAERRGPYNDARRDRGPPSPHQPPRERWARNPRERSRSPLRGTGFKDYHRDSYMDRGREDRRGGTRERMDDAY